MLTSPVTLEEFQFYIFDTSTDTDLLAFYQRLLDGATERVYTYLGRDYTPEAEKTDVFFGTSMHVHRMDNPAGEILSWKYYDAYGNETVVDISELVLMARGTIAVAASKIFYKDFEHRITYKQPDSLQCPETVKQAIIEIAAIIFEESKQGGGNLGRLLVSDRIDADYERVRFIELSPRHLNLLAPYKRIAV